MSTQKTQPSRRVCILTRELYGVRSLSDAGAAILGLAQQLADAGDQVTMLWVPPIAVAVSLEAPTRREITERMAENHLIDLRILTDSPVLSPHLHSPEKGSLAAYHYIKSEPFDEVYCALEGGLAYYMLLAKEQNLLTAKWPLTLLVHSPAEWAAEADKTFVTNLLDIAIWHMERYCVENAANIVFNSQYIRNWVVQKGWRLVAKPKVITPLLPHELRLERQSHRLPKGAVMKEVGIWPGWEFRLGLVLLCDALDKLAQDGKTGLTINFFGPFSRLLGEHTGGLLVRRARPWPFTLRFFPRLTEKENLEYLRQKNGTALFPYSTSAGSRLQLACIEAGIPIIATDTGSASEFVAPAEKSTLHQPSAAAMMEGLRQAMSRRSPTVAPAKARTEIENNWEQHRSALRRQVEPRSAVTPKSGGNVKLVSIVIAHFERPKFLADAVKSVEQQDYPNIEVIVVDDGSTKPEAVAFLKGLETAFKKRRWKIIRQKNKYLGAARNAGIKAARGDYILFLDDDNALLGNAVSTFVKALESSGADICTSMSKIFLGPHLPRHIDDGKIEYFPLGGSLDCAFVHNSFGDANAIIRKEVFAKIGYLLEDYGFVASDWEFFTRAALNGLKIRIIPEATYWYRSSADGMFRTAHWYETRLPILKLFEKYHFKGLGPIYQLLIAQNTDDSERNGYHFRLRYNLANERFEKLDMLDPESDEAIQHLAGIASAEGRSDTALNLLGQVRASFATQVQKSWSVTPLDEISLTEERLAPAEEMPFDLEKLRRFSIASTQVTGEAPVSFVEAPCHLTIQSSPQAMIVATLTGALPAGSVSLTFIAWIPEEIVGPVEILAGLIEPQPSATGSESASSGSPGNSVNASSGWVTLAKPFEVRRVNLMLESPLKAPATLVICIRHAAGAISPQKTLVRMSDMSCSRFQGLGPSRRPRLGSPPDLQYARAYTEDEMRKAELATVYNGDRNLLEFPPSEKGFLLRPSRMGPVVAVLPWAFPAFAKGIVGSVEITGEDPSPFEFSLALARPSALGEWNYQGPLSAEAFSGWVKVTRGFELQEVAVHLRESRRFALSVCAAVRLPPDSNPEHAATFWRKLVLHW